MIKLEDQSVKIANKYISDEEERLFSQFVSYAEDELLGIFNTIIEDTDDFVLHSHYYLITECLKYINTITVDQRNKPLFLYRDGPITEAVKYGRLLFLEDFDLPSQAVTERLNSLLENNPKFNLIEDIHSNSVNSSYPKSFNISKQFQIIASVHNESEFQQINISPAALSRFTELRVEAYTSEDIIDLINSEFIHILSVEPQLKNTVLSGDLKAIIDLIISLRNIIIETEKGGGGGTKLNLLQKMIFNNCSDGLILLQK